MAKETTATDARGMGPGSGAGVSSALDQDWRNRPIVKEMSTKLAWAIGSTLHTTYGEKGATYKWAEELALRIYTAHKKVLGNST